MLDVAGLFGDNLARARKSADISQEELGVMASVHRTEISQLERGLRIARVDTLAKLCGSLEVDPGELMAGIAWEPGGTRYGRFLDRRERATDIAPNGVFVNEHTPPLRSLTPLKNRCKTLRPSCVLFQPNPRRAEIHMYSVTNTHTKGDVSELAATTYTNHRGFLMSMARKHSASSEEAEGALQEALCAFIRLMTPRRPRHFLGSFSL